MSASVRMSGWEELGDRLEAAAAALEEERAVSDAMITAVQPAVARIAEIVGTGSAWKETGFTSRDISAALNKEGEAGSRVAVDIGAGPRHAFKLRFLEFGTSRDPAYPALRPGWDAAEPAVRAAVIEELKRLLPMLR